MSTLDDGHGRIDERSYGLARVPREQARVFSQPGTKRWPYGSRPLDQTQLLKKLKKKSGRALDVAGLNRLIEELEEDGAAA